MSDIMRKYTKHVLAVAAILGLGILSNNCKKTEDGSGVFIGPAALNGVFQFYAKVDNSLTASCGSATVPESTSTSGSSGSSGSGSTTTTTTYNIKSNYYFADNLAYQGQQMVLRYVYSQTRHSYSLSIANTATTTCQTSDGISCDSVGTKTCVTSDSVTCGGANAFIFSIRNPAMTFTGSVGTIDYSQGFSLTTDNSAVNNATLDINMSAADGTLFVGKVTCVSDPS